MRRIASALVALGAAGGLAAGSAAAMTPAAAATSHAAACSTHWGINAKHRGDNMTTVATRVRAVRASTHGCCASSVRRVMPPPRSRSSGDPWRGTTR